MPEINFLVAGSSDDPYEVTFLRNEQRMVVLCTCPAGENRRHCKHRIGILNGSPDNIVSDNLDDIATVREWVAGTGIEQALAALNAAPAGDKAALAAARRRLAAEMND